MAPTKKSQGKATKAAPKRAPKAPSSKASKKAAESESEDEGSSVKKVSRKKRYLCPDCGIEHTSPATHSFSKAHQRWVDELEYKRMTGLNYST